MVIFHKNEYLLRIIISKKLIGNLHLTCYIVIIFYWSIYLISTNKSKFLKDTIYPIGKPLYTIVIKIRIK